MVQQHEAGFFKEVCAHSPLQRSLWVSVWVWVCVGRGGVSGELLTLSNCQVLSICVLSTHQ
jgi:hypothetical protein